PSRPRPGPEPDPEPGPEPALRTDTERVDGPDSERERRPETERREPEEREEDDVRALPELCEESAERPAAATPVGGEATMPVGETTGAKPQVSQYSSPPPTSS
ncbi:hypothetical protein ABT381_35590, partial [Streptomyces sp. NPDC000151]